MRILIIFFALSLHSNPLGNLGRIRRSLDKLEFDKAHELLIKAQAKEKNNPGVYYLSAVLYSTEAWQSFNLDTARIFVAVSLKKLENADEEMLEDLSEDDINKPIVEALRNTIRDRIHTNVLSDLSISNAEKFMMDYPASPYEQSLIFKRDSIVFEQVKKNDSEGMYEDFLKKYSTTKFREQAAKRIDELRYQVLAHSGKLKDYYQFLKDHPKTRFRDEIEHFVFQVSTADHTVKSYSAFTNFAKNKQLRKKAADILYYMEDQKETSFLHLNADSIALIDELRKLELIPAMESDRFGFHTKEGAIQIPYTFDNVDDLYKCRLITDEWLLVETDGSKRIITKSGIELIDNVTEYKDLGFGIAQVRIHTNWFIYHKSGFKILEEPIEDAGVLNGRWLKIRRNGKWSIWSISGFQITSGRFTNIEITGSFWVFERDGLLAVYNENLIAERLMEGLEPEFKFDDLELVSNEVIIGFRGDRECMLNSELDFLIPWGVYEINPEDSGWYLKTANGYRLYDRSEQELVNQTHPYLETNTGWLALKTQEDWMLLARNQQIEPTRGYDSLKLINEFCAYAEKGEEHSLVFSNGKILKIDSTQRIRSFFNKPEYFLIEDQDLKIILDKDGNELIRELYEEVSFMNDSLLKVGINGRHGLLKLNGEIFIDIEYDVLDENDGLILCLQDGKIGLVDLVKEATISPVSESRIERVGDNYLVKKEGKYGLIDTLETTVLDFVYDEIRVWNDTSYLVRNDVLWNFVNKNAEPMTKPVEFLTELTSDSNESMWKFVREGKYGLLSNQNGILLDPEFTDIFNIGSEDDPIFFADQHLDKARFHVVSYINKKGKLILSKAYTKIEFDKVLCED